MSGPYRGLASFGESDLDGLLFFGRERETDVVTANLLASRLTVLYGASGVGKSSLVQAGVARRIRDRGDDLVCVVFSAWADEPAAALAEAIGGAVRPLVSPAAPEPPLGASLADVAEHWSTLLDGDVYLVLDQFEEYFIYTHARDLIAELPDLVLRPGVRANVLISMRDDELARLGALKNTLPDVFTNTRRLDPLDRKAARIAIVGPLQRWNELHADASPVGAEPALVDSVIDQVADADGVHVEAPYLQLVLERLWGEEEERDSRTLRLRTLDELGGAEVIVREHLERALGVLDAEQQELAAEMLRHLVTPSGMKIAHRASDLAAFAQADETLARELLEILGRERLVRPVDDASGMQRRYEIYHDVLAEPIAEWEQRRELEAERRAAQRRQRRLLVLAAVALGLTVVMAAITVYALAQRSDARSQTAHARSTALVAGALATVGDDPERALLLARAAVGYNRSRTVESALRTALAAARARAVLRGQIRGVLAAGFSNGKVLTIDGAGTLRTFSPQSAPASSAVPLEGRVRAAAVAANGSALVVARRRLVEVRALTGGASYAFRVRSPVRAVAIDGRGDRIAVASLDGDIVVHSTVKVVAVVRPSFMPTTLALDRTGRTLGAAGGVRAAAWRVGQTKPSAKVTTRADVTAVALSPDGRLLATATTAAAVGFWTVRGGVFAGQALGPNPMTTVTFDGQGEHVAAGSTDGRTRIFSVTAGLLVAVLAGHTDAVTAAAFSRGGDLLVTGSRDSTARVWNPGVAPDLQPVAHPANCCTALTTGPNGVLVAAGARVIRFVHGRQVAVYRQPARVTAVAWSGSNVVAGGADGRVRIFPSGVTLTIGRPVGAVAATASRIAASTARGLVDVYSSRGKRLLQLHEQSGVSGLAISGDGQLLATAGTDDVARIRKLPAGTLVHELALHTKPVTSVAFSPDGSLLATASVDHDIRTWDVATGRPSHLLRGHFGTVSDVAFSPDGRWLVSAGPTSAGLWETSDGHLLQFLYGRPKGRLVGAGFDADGRTVTTASADGVVRAYTCDLCRGLDGLLQLADARLAATGAQLSAPLLAQYVSP